MLDSFTIGVVVSGLLVFFGVSIALISLRVFKSDSLSQRIQEFVDTEDNISDSGDDIIAVRDRLEGSLFTRTIVPRFKTIIMFLGQFAPKRSVNELNRNLSIAGNPFGMHALEFNGIQLVLFLLGLIFVLLVNINTYIYPQYKLITSFAVMVIFLLGPYVWLRSRVRSAKDIIRREFPDILDMLSVCAYAGLGFDQALQRVAESLHSVLGNEIRRTVQEMELGSTRAEALRNLANRLDVNELSSFVAIIIQAENLGMRIADVLHAQAGQMRVLRQYRAKETANKLPAKMLFPLAIFILPALFAVIFAPVIPALLDLFNNF